MDEAGYLAGEMWLRALYDGSVTEIQERVRAGQLARAEAVAELTRLGAPVDEAREIAAGWPGTL